MDPKDKFILWLALLGTVIMLALIGLLYAPVRADEPCQLGDWMCDHDKYHNSGFYPNLKRDKDDFSCCSDADCRPSQVRIVQGEYFVLVDRKWCPFDEGKIASYKPPKGLPLEHPKDVWSTAHVCSTDGRKREGGFTDICPHIYCVRLPNLM